jgi:signal transduction histidine kinase
MGRKRSRSRRSDRRDRGDEQPPLTPEERAFRSAQRRANARLSFYTHAVAWASVSLGLVLITRSVRVGMIVAGSWGVGLAIHYFAAVVAPGLRQKLLKEEVGRQVEQGVHRERRAIENRNARSLETLSASIAHEIRSPITAAKSLVQQMGEDPVAVENIEYARVALDELDRVERSISHLLRFARDTDLRVEPMRLSGVLDSALETLRERIERMGAEVHVEFDGEDELEGDPEKLRRVAINLVGNALDALEDASVDKPRVEVAGGENLAGSDVWMRVRDNGPGIDAAQRGRIFSPFYTTKGDGTGLGLALTKKVVEAHGGTIEVQSDPGWGTEFVVVLPKHGAPARSENG